MWAAATAAPGGPGTSDDYLLQGGPGSLKKKSFRRSTAAWMQGRGPDLRSSLLPGSSSLHWLSLLPLSPVPSSHRRPLSWTCHSLADKSSELAHRDRDPSTHPSPGPQLKAFPRMAPKEPSSLLPTWPCQAAGKQHPSLRFPKPTRPLHASLCLLSAVALPVTPFSLLSAR